MQLIKKLSSKSIISNVKQVALDNFYEKGDLEKKRSDAPKEVQLYRILGVCNGIKTGQTDNGDWVSFEGDFKATTFEDEPEEYRAPRAFLAEPASSMLCTALESGDTVEMAFIVSIVAANNAYGYEYRCSPLLPVQESDAISALETKLLALAAPKKETKKSKKK